MADCLSCLVDAKTGKEDPTLNLQIADVRLDQMPIDWNQMKKSYLNDLAMVKLARVMQWGWPESSRELPEEVKVYFLADFSCILSMASYFSRIKSWYQLGFEMNF